MKRAVESRLHFRYYHAIRTGYKLTSVAILYFYTYNSIVCAYSDALKSLVAHLRGAHIFIAKSTSDAIDFEVIL